MDATAIIDVLSRTVPAAGLEPVQSADGMPTIAVTREQLVDTCRALRDTPELRFAFLADLFPVDYLPREPRFEIVYLMASLGMSGFGETPKRLRVKVRLPGDDAMLPSVSSVWPAANWSEREAYDLFGIHFSDHPDLRRILMPDDWDGYPLRKDYPVQIKLPVKTYEPLQVSQEQFVASIEATRDRARKE
ncbi:MAG: NADH-quinone oxidoreductase subunit C [Acidobacteriota bacterium]|jgi:NADH-quinone oxidoreductase subunit C|nr:NADH-quinone oxidoreductase subunit C [Acidobacteriota bacterium]